MKVYMINSGYSGCCYVRIMLPAFHNGFASDRKSVRDLTFDRSVKDINLPEIKYYLDWADIVVFHRPEYKTYHKLADMLREKGKKIVMDNDDTFKLDDYYPLANFMPDAYQVNLRKRNEAIDSFIQKADLVTTSTEFLAQEYRKLNDNVAVLPNCVDPMDWDTPLRNETDKVRIGLVGSATFEYDFLHIKDVLKKINKRKDVQLFLFGLGSKEHRKKNPEVTKMFKGEYDFWDSLEGLEWIPWCPIHEYPTKLNEARLDIMLIPRKDNYFNRCKSNIKFLEAAMCEIPVIAQSFDHGPYEELRGKNMGILVEDNKDWERYINEMIDNKEMRREMGRNAREYALNNYKIETNAH